MTLQSDSLKTTSRWHVLACVICLVAIVDVVPVFSAQDSTPNVKLFTGKKASDSLQRLRSVALQSVPLSDVIADLQTSLQFAIVLDHRIDPQQPITLASGLVNSREVLRRVAETVGADVTFTDRFAVVGPSDSVMRLRTVMELRRKELQALRTKLGSKSYQLWFDDIEAGWPDLMQPDRFVVEQIQAAGMTRKPESQLPHDLWRSQQLPPLNLIQRLSVVVNQFDLTFRVDGTGMIEIVPVEENPTVRRRMRIPADRREAVESLLQTTKPSVEVSWSGSRLTLVGRIELMEAVESAIRNEEASNVQEGLKTQLFTMSIPAGSTISRVIESLKVTGISIRIQGLKQPQLAQYLQTKVELDAQRMLGAEFFPALLQVDGGTVQVEGKYVLIQF